MSSVPTNYGDLPSRAASEYQAEDEDHREAAAARPPTWLPNDDPVPSGSSHLSAKGGPSSRSHGSRPPSEHDIPPEDVVTMSMLQRNNDQLVKMLMAMFREPRPTEDYDPYDSDASPIGEPLGPPNTVRLMPVEALHNFHGDRENKDAAAMWLQRFEETAVACGWSDKEVLRRFRLHSDKPVHDWLFQIDSIHLTTCSKLRARFVKEFVKSPIPKTEVYYNMTQGPSEHIKAYFVRFNAAALRIRLDYRKSRDFLEEHIDRFART
ncbi:hypothetical protein AeNC1_018977, partial [Aphanomyces euteiches]